MKRPPLGLKPRWIHDLARFQDVCCAMVRYADTGRAIPSEWQEEHDELRERLRSRLGRMGDCVAGDADPPAKDP